MLRLSVLRGTDIRSGQVEVYRVCIPSNPIQFICSWVSNLNTVETLIFLFNNQNNQIITNNNVF
jgi:hypothetical protein